MRALLALPFLVLPAAAQEAPPEPPSLMEEGLRLFMEGLSREMAPMLEDLETMRREAAPLLERLEEGLGEAVGSLDAYHPPEMLPNGDIILRRRTPLEMPAPAPETEPEAEPPLPDDEGAIEL
jgi:hypothetical protein